MKYTNPIGCPSKLPALIRTTLEERSGYHHRFFNTFIWITFLLLLVLAGVVFMLRNEDLGVQLLLDLLWLIFPGITGYFVFYHRKRKQVLDDCLSRDVFSTVSGTLGGIQHLGKKQARYIVDGHAIDGKLVFPGFTAFQNTWVVDVVTTHGQAVELYLLPNGLIAGVIYPELDSGSTSRPIAREDWQLIAQLLWGGVKIFAYVGLFLSLLAVAICWFIERESGNGWEMMGIMLIVFNGIILLFIAIHLLVNWPQLRALMDKYHPSLQVQVYRGVSAEWYLTGTKYGRSSSSTTFNGWIRMAGALHQIQFDNLFAPDNDVLEPLKMPTQLEYLVYKGRLIFLRSTTKDQLDRL